MCSLDSFEFHIKLLLHHRLKIDAHQPVLGLMVLVFNPASEIHDEPNAGNDRKVISLPLVLDELKVR
jgi:hypothetical protein